MSKDSANLYTHVFQGLGSPNQVSSALPPQAIPSYKKKIRKVGRRYNGQTRRDRTKADN